MLFRSPPAAFDSRRHPRLPPTCMDACPHPRSCALRPLEGPFRAVCTKGHIRLPAANAWLRDRESRLRGEHGRACFFLSSLSLWPPAIAAYGPMSSELYLLHCAHERTLCAQLGRAQANASATGCMHAMARQRVNSQRQATACTHYMQTGVLALSC